MKCPQCGCEHMVYTEYREPNSLPWFNILFVLFALIFNNLPGLLSIISIVINSLVFVIAVIFNIVAYIKRPKSMTKATCPECGYVILN